MITYEVRGETLTIGYATKESALQHKSRPPHPTLWQVERESEAEAAVRRMKYLSDEEKSPGTTMIVLSGRGKTLAEMIDEKCTPPAPKETQLDWNTGEPIELIEVLPLDNGLWLSRIQSAGFKGASDRIEEVLDGRIAIAHTANAARDGLRAILASLKAQTK